MATTKRTITDGVTSVELTTFITPPGTPEEEGAFRDEHNALRAFAEETSQRLTFDGRVAELERVCMRDRVLPDPRRLHEDQRPPYGSRAWDANQILISIRIVRDALVDGHAELAASEALVVGALAAEAEAKHNWCGVVQLGIKRRRDTQASGRGRGQQITTARHKEDEKTRQLVRLYRTSDEQQGHLVAFVAQQLGRNAQVIRRRLKRLGLAE